MERIKDNVTCKIMNQIMYSESKRKKYSRKGILGKPGSIVTDSQGNRNLFYKPYHEYPKRNDRDSPHTEGVHSAESMMLPQCCKENQLAGPVPLENCSPQLCCLSSICLLYLLYMMTESYFKKKKKKTSHPKQEK